MKTLPLFPLLAAALLFASCNDSNSESSAPPELPPIVPPTAEVVAALQAQPIGSKLLGHTARLSTEGFQPADLTIAPEVYLIYYSASWCPPCRKGAPDLVRSYHAHIADNPKVELIHVSYDEEEAAALAWAKEERFPWPTVLMPQHKAVDLERFAGEYVPEYILISADGTALAQGKEECFKQIAALQ